MNNRQLLGIRVTLDLVAELFKNSKEYHLKTVSKIPEDAVLLKVNYLPDADCFLFIYEHSSFPIVHEGDLIPVESAPTITNIKD